MSTSKQKGKIAPFRHRPGAPKRAPGPTGSATAYSMSGRVSVHGTSQFDQGRALLLDPATRERGAALIHEAAETGDLTAQIAPGTMYTFCGSVEKDVEEAARWYRMSAEQGNPDAQFPWALPTRPAKE